MVVVCETWQVLCQNGPPMLLFARQTAVHHQLGHKPQVSLCLSARAADQLFVCVKLKGQMAFLKPMEHIYWGVLPMPASISVRSCANLTLISVRSQLLTELKVCRSTSSHNSSKPQQLRPAWSTD